MSPGVPTAFPITHTDPDLREGVHFNLWNNLWCALTLRLLRQLCSTSGRITGVLITSCGFRTSQGTVGRCGFALCSTQLLVEGWGVWLVHDGI